LILFEAMDETKTWWEIMDTISVLTRRTAEAFMVGLVLVQQDKRRGLCQQVDGPRISMVSIIVFVDRHSSHHSFITPAECHILN
jgi:hypothetical protein